MNIPEEAYTQILEELERAPLDINKYKTVAGEGRCQVFGLVGRRCLSPDYSRNCWKRPYLYKLLLEFGRKYVPFEFSSITVDDTYSYAKRRDKGNSGPAFFTAFGSFTGGGLEVEGLEASKEGTLDVKHKGVVFDSSKVFHSVETFTGKRYSICYYNLKNKVDVPPPSIVEEGGRFLFKRGEEIITKGQHKTKRCKGTQPSVRFEEREVIIVFD